VDNFFTSVRVLELPLSRLSGYYDHLAELAKGYKKDAAKLEENLPYVGGWKDEVERLMDLLATGN
jgi:hypothetical protein